jgi:hypothetical protein
MLVINYTSGIEIDDKIINTIKSNSKRYSVRTKSIKSENVELICEVKIKVEESILLNELNKNKNVNSCSLVAHSNNMLDV